LARSETYSYPSWQYRSGAPFKPLPPSDPPPTPPSTLVLLDLLGRRWALRILWELRQQPANFQALQRRCDSMSTSVLSRRLVELRDAQLIEKDQAGDYALTEAGLRLLTGLDSLDD
jgi:DNA-binding HxlR family transcriptional regulator